jgi:hypothetical protein
MPNIAAAEIAVVEAKLVYEVVKRKVQHYFSGKFVKKMDQRTITAMQETITEKQEQELFCLEAETIWG